MERIQNYWFIRRDKWAPFGEGRGYMFTEPMLAEIGAKYEKTEDFR